MDAFGFIRGVLDERNCSLKRNAVGVVDVGPDSLDVAVVDILNHVGVVVLSIASREMVVALSLPECKLSVSHPDVIVRVVFGQPRNEIPRLIFAVHKSDWVGSQESKPESEPILFQVGW